jgi:hypothetical protein
MTAGYRARDNAGMHASHRRLSKEQIEQWRRRRSLPENEMPAAVGLTALLGHTDDAAVGLTQIEAFSTGFRFSLAVRLRRSRPETADGRLYLLISSHPRPGVEVDLADRLLLGVEYPDGRRASNLDDFHFPATAPDLMLSAQGGGGGDLSVDQSYWVSPLPPDGPVTFVLSWASFGMPESRVALDGATIRAAGERSQVLWPVQPPEEERPPPAAPPRPATGWFADPPG